MLASMWEIKIIGLTADNRRVTMHFAAMGPDGEEACAYVLREHKKELKGIEIESEIYSPMRGNSIFIFWELRD